MWLLIIFSWQSFNVFIPKFLIERPVICASRLSASTLTVRNVLRHKQPSRASHHITRLTEQPVDLQQSFGK